MAKKEKKYTREAIVSTLNENRGELMQTCNDLGVSLKTLYNWIQDHKIIKEKRYK